MEEDFCMVNILAIINNNDKTQGSTENMPTIKFVSWNLFNVVNKERDCKQLITSTWDWEQLC